MEYGMILKLNLNYINQISIASRGRNFRGAEQVCEWLLQGRCPAMRRPGQNSRPVDRKSSALTTRLSN